VTLTDKLNIILIDDDHISNLINSKMIGKYNADVKLSVFLKAQEALKKLPEIIDDSPTIIFLDINMPEMNGWEFLDAFDFKKGNCRVYMLTSSINESDKQKAASYSVVESFISKPLSFEKLKSVF
jgi:response regulator RpfG family c-di-GMP phosphodiesterase